MPEIAGTRRMEEVRDPHNLADVDVGVVRAQFGVAESGAVWLTQEAKKSLSSMPSASYRNISLSYWIRTKSSRICTPPIVVCDSTKPRSDVL
jgi:hypothetical protein